MHSHVSVRERIEGVTHRDCLELQVTSWWLQAISAILYSPEFRDGWSIIRVWFSYRRWDTSFSKKEMQQEHWLWKLIHRHHFAGKRVSCLQSITRNARSFLCLMDIFLRIERDPDGRCYSIAACLKVSKNVLKVSKRLLEVSSDFFETRKEPLSGCG